MILNPDVIGFYALAVVAVVASLRVIMHKNPVHAILSLIVSLLAVAGIFFILGAAFAGVLEIIVYAGAILVLFVFVIMMLNLGKQNEAQEQAWLSSKAWAVPFGLSLVVAAVLIGFVLSEQSVQQLALSTTAIDAKMVGISLFTHYALLVQVAAFLLLGALVAAYHLGKKALDDENTSHFQNTQDTKNSHQNAVSDNGVIHDKTVKNNIVKSSTVKDNTVKDSMAKDTKNDGGITKTGEL